MNTTEQRIAMRNALAAIVASEYIPKQNNINYLFSTQVKACITKIEALAKQKDNGIKVISLIGQRGSGKTSVLRTVKKQCESDLGKELFLTSVIDPTKFSDAFNILEIVLTEIYTKLQTSRNNDQISCYQDSVEKAFFQVIKTLTSLRLCKSKKSYFYGENTDAFVTEQIKNTHQLEKNLGEFITNFLKHYDLKQMVLFIDDLDLVPNSHINAMLEDISHYLGRNVITVIAFRYEQLQLAVLNKELTQNKILLDRQKINDEEIERRVKDYLTKNFPRAYAIELPTVDTILNNWTIKNLFENLGVECSDLSDKTIGAFIFEESYTRTKVMIQPIDEVEKTRFLYGNSLRTIISYLYKVLSMEEVTDEKDFKKYSNNIKVLENIYFSEESLSILTFQQKELITEWLVSKNNHKNYRMIQYFYYEIVSILRDNNYKTGLIDATLVAPKNVCLGDVYHYLTIYKKVKQLGATDAHFVYLIKLLYTIELTKATMDYLSGNENAKNDYCQLVNYKITKNEFVYTRDIYFNNEIQYGEKQEEEISKETLKKELSRLKRSRGNLRKKPEQNYQKIVSLDEEIEALSQKLVNVEAEIPKDSVEKIALEFDVLTKYMYSARASRGEHTKNQRPIIKQKQADDVLNLEIHTYYGDQDYFITGENEITLKRTHKYYIDFYTYFLTPEYLNRLKENYLVSEHPQYLFTNVFSLDMIHQKNYSRSSSKAKKQENIQYIFDRQADCITEMMRRNYTFFTLSEGEEYKRELEQTNDAEMIAKMAEYIKGEGEN